MENNALDLLGRLLATENIQITHKYCTTASFHIKDRVLTLPIWENISPTQEILLIGHETGHALWTTDIYCKNAVDKTRPGFSSFLNICEDARIERMIKNLYPGLRRDFYNGYTEFIENDFFKINGRDVNKLSLIDRINLHTKVGTRLGIKFNQDEQTLLDILESTVTEAAICDIARSIYDLSKQQQQEETESKETESKETESKETELKETELKENPREAETQKSFEDTLVGCSISGDELTYKISPNLSAPIKFIPVTAILKDFQQIDQSSVIDLYKEFNKSNSRLISQMVAVFELKKAASKMQRTLMADTGTLNMSKIYKYKIATEIFKQYKIEVESTNHGFVMLLDYSGSMASNFTQVMSRIITLVQFCTAVDIKFEVLAFTDSPYLYTAAERANTYKSYTDNAAKLKDKELAFFSYKHVSILQFYKSGMTRSEINLISWVLYNRVLMRKKNIVVPTDINRKYALCSTPLIEAMLYINSYLHIFKEKNNLQKISLIMLTDGCGSNTELINSNSYNYSTKPRLIVIRNNTKITMCSTVTNKTYNIIVEKNNIYPQDIRNIFQRTLTQLISDDHTDVKIIAFYIAPVKIKKLREAMRFYQPSNKDLNDYDLDITKISADLKNIGYSKYEMPGYDKFFVLPELFESESELYDLVLPNMTASQMTRIASKNTTKLKAARIIASEFIDEIA